MSCCAGQRALDYLSRTWEQAKTIGQHLSVKPVDAAAAVERLEGELSALKMRCAGLEEAVFTGIAAEQAGKGNVLLFQPSMKPDSVRKLADAVSKTCGGLAQCLPEKVPISLRSGPRRRAGYQRCGEGAERCPPWPGRWPERLCSGQRGSGAERH